MLILTSCHGSGKGAMENVSSVDTLRSVVDIVQIELPVHAQPGLVYPSLLSKDDMSELLVAYSPFDHALVFFDLSNREFLRKVKLEEQGPNLVPPVRTVAYVKENVIWLGSDYELTKVDLAGQVGKRIKISEGRPSIKDFDFAKLELSANGKSGLQILEGGSSALLNINSLDRQFPQRYIGERLVELDLTKQLLIPLSVRIPEDYSALEGNYGELTRVGFSRNQDKLVYNFPMSSDIFLFDGNRTKRFKLSSLYADNMAKPIEASDGNIDLARARHLYNALTYYPPFYDPHQNLYYRSYKTEIDNDLEEAEYYCAVFDEDLNKQGEFKFPDNYYVYPIISKEGLMFMAFNKHDDKLELIRYRFNEELE